MSPLIRALDYFGGVIVAAALLWIYALWRIDEIIFPPPFDDPLHAVVLGVVGAGMLALRSVLVAGLRWRVARARRIAARPAAPPRPDVTFEDAFRATGDMRPGEAPMAALARVRAARVDHHQGRARLIVSVPQRPSQSWIGGIPHLPPGTPWPIVRGQPAAFVAQIALADLPRNIWGGTGPRDGWLVFFAEAARDNAAGWLMHVTGPVDPRPTPDGVVPVTGFWEKAALPLLRDLGADTTLPRWYLEAVPDSQSDYTASDVHEMMAQTPLRNVLRYVDPHKADLYQPIDWVTARGWLLLLERSIRADLDHRRNTLPADEAERLTKAVALTLARLRLIAKGAALRAGEAEFTEDERTKLFNAVSDLSTTDWLTPVARAAGKTGVPLTRWPFGDGYMALFEAQARRVYTTTPWQLPDLLRNNLERVWAEDAARTWIFAGNTRGVHSIFGGDPCLIDMPSNDLTGMIFGDMARWGVRIAPADLARGNFAAAEAWCAKA